MWLLYAIVSLTITQRTVRAKLPSQRLGLHVDHRRRVGEVFEQRRAEPAFHRRGYRFDIGAIPRAAELFAGADEPGRVAGERRGREEQAEAAAGVGDWNAAAIEQRVDHLRHAGDERLLLQADRCVIED